ncbi:MAG: hypothetical protein AAB377_03070 [Patescibacteria group bacterium]
MGNLHARNKKFKFKESGGGVAYYNPVGARLNGKAISVCVKYGKGNIKNFKIIKLKDSISLKRIGKRKEMLLPAKRDRYFDFHFIIKETKPL